MMYVYVSICLCVIQIHLLNWSRNNLVSWIERRTDKNKIIISVVRSLAQVAHETLCYTCVRNSLFFVLLSSFFLFVSPTSIYLYVFKLPIKWCNNLCDLYIPFMLVGLVSFSVVYTSFLFQLVSNVNLRNFHTATPMKDTIMIMTLMAQKEVHTSHTLQKTMKER